MIVVMIAGASGSGKTVFSEQLLEQLTRTSHSCQLINLDNYYKERDEQRYPDIDLFRLEPEAYLPTHLNLQQLRDDLTSLAKGQSIYQKEFIFSTNLYKRNAQGECVLKKIDPSAIVIIEGLFAQHFAHVYLPMEYPRVSVNIASSSYQHLIETRIKRDTAPPPLGRQITREQVINNECHFVGPVFFQYTAKHASGSDVYVLNDHDNLHHNSFDQSIQDVIERINMIQNALASNLYWPKSKPRDALEIARESIALAKKAQSPHPKHDLIKERQLRSKTFGPFFKSPVMEETKEPLHEPSLGQDAEYNESAIEFF